MENVCHTLTGVALARAGLRRTTPLATVALVVGANIPDVDLAWSSFGSVLTYFHRHRGWTHSIAGAAALAVLLWVALLALDRALLARRSVTRARPLWLLAVSALGVASHVLMDFANSYGVRPFLPWSDRWVYGDLWVVVDPWLWLFLGGAVYASGAGGWRRDWVWLLGAAAAAVVVLPVPIVPVPCRLAWAAALAATLVVCRAASRRPGDGTRAARAGLGLLLAYAILCAVLHQSALARVARAAPADEAGASAVVAALPLPADPLRWEAIVAGANVIRHGTVGTLAGLDADGPREAILSRGLDAPPAAALMRSCAGEVLREFFRFPFATIEDEPEGGRVVVVRDARYTRRGRGFATYAVPLDDAGAPLVDRSQCP